MFLIALAVLLLLAVVFFATRKISNAPHYETMAYNGFEFTKLGPLWYFQWQQGDKLYNVPLRYNPKEVLDVPLVGTYDERFQQQDIYITHDPAETGLTYVALGTSELSISLANVMKANLIASCSANTTEACWDRPIVTCDDKDKAVIYIRKSPETKIIFAGNCAVIEGDGVDLLRAVDKLLYMWYKVI